MLGRAGRPLGIGSRMEDFARRGRRARLRLLTRHRGYGTRTELFDGFPDDVRWQWMAATPAELATVRFINYDYWAELSGPTRLAADAAPRIRAGVAPFGQPSDWALGMAQAVADGAQFPPLILVTTGPGGGLVVLEGHARLTAFMLAHDRLPELEVLVGTSPTITSWGFGSRPAAGKCGTCAISSGRSRLLAAGRFLHQGVRSCRTQGEAPAPEGTFTARSRSSAA